MAATGYGEVSATIRVTATVEPSLGLSRSSDLSDTGNSNAWALWKPAGERIMMSTYMSDCCVNTNVQESLDSDAAVSCLERSPFPRVEEAGTDLPADSAFGETKPVTRTILIFDPGT